MFCVNIIWWVLSFYNNDKQISKEEFFDKQINSSDRYSLKEKSDIETIRAIYNELSPKFAKCVNEIKNNRNDINHCGMRQHPKDCNRLEDDLKSYYENIKGLIEDILRKDRL